MVFQLAQGECAQTSLLTEAQACLGGHGTAGMTHLEDAMSGSYTHIEQLRRSSLEAMLTRGGSPQGDLPQGMLPLGDTRLEPFDHEYFILQQLDDIDSELRHLTVEAFASEYSRTSELTKVVTQQGRSEWLPNVAHINCLAPGCLSAPARSGVW